MTANNPVVFPPRAEPYRTASLEEDAMLIESAAAAVGELDAELQEAHRLQDTAGTLQNVVMYAPLIDNARPIDLYMLQATAELATAGSDITPAEVSPSLERYVGRKPSVEGFRSWLGGIWKVIVEALKRAWNAVADFFSSILGTIPRLRFFLKREIELLEAVSNEHRWSETVKVGSELFAFSVRNKFPKDFKEIEERLDALSAQVEYYMGEYVELAKVTYNDVALGLEHMDEGSLDTCLNMISEDVMNLAKRCTPGSIGLIPANHSQLSPDYRKLPDLPGDRTICIRAEWKNTPDTNYPLDRAAHIQRNSMTVITSKDTSRLREYEERSFPTLSVQQLIKLCNVALTYCDYVERLNDGLIQIRKDKDRIAEASRDIVDRAEDEQRVNGVTSRDVQYYHAAIRYNTMLTSLVATPCLHLSSIAMRVSRAVLTLSKRTREANPSVKPA